MQQTEGGRSLHFQNLPKRMTPVIAALYIPSVLGTLIILLLWSAQLRAATRTRRSTATTPLANLSSPPSSPRQRHGHQRWKRGYESEMPITPLELVSVTAEPKSNNLFVL